MTRQIPLGKSGKVALVDDADYPLISTLRWWFDRQNGVAKTMTVLDGKKVTILMHRLIMNPPRNMDVDHKNHDQLNNCRSNLRVVTRRQNIHNRRKSKPNGTCPYKGVSWDVKSSKWKAQIKVGKVYHLGDYPTPEDAARAYDMAARYHFGEYAYTNFQEDRAASIETVRLLAGIKPRRHLIRRASNQRSH